MCRSLAKNESRRWGVIPFIGGGSHHNTARGSFDSYQLLLVFSIRGLVGIILPFQLPECFHILFHLGLSGSLTVPIIVELISTLVACNTIQVSPGSLILLFYISVILPSFPALRKHELVDDPSVVIISIIIIIMLII